MPRICFLSWEVYVGTVFLARTVEMTELILNAVALEVVLRIDALLLAVFMPEQANILVHKIFPFPVRRAKGFVVHMRPLSHDYL